MNAAEFVAFARKLLTIPAARCPAGFRTVTSRMYYGVYHDALEFVETELGFAHRKWDDTENKHIFVIEYLIGSDDEQAKDLASQLRQMHQRRKDADYELAKLNVDEETHAIESVARADRILKALDACRHDLLRTKIQAGMSLYRTRRSGRSTS